MKFFILILLAAAAYAEQLEGLLDALPTDILSGLVENDSKMLKDADKTSTLKKVEPMKLSAKPLSLMPPAPFGAQAGKGKLLKAAAAAPIKKIVAKKAVSAKALAVPKLKALKSKPKVHSLKPIVYVVEKPVPVYHRVPVPKKVLVPKFYPVIKKIPVPKIIPVPFKVPVKKIIPKIVKIPKAIPIPKIVPVKKPVPIAIPYPVPKFYKFPVSKPVPYAKYIPIPFPKKVPKFVPFPVKKIIKVPKPYYVPIKVPYITASYVKTPMKVNVPDIKKVPSGGKFGGFQKPKLGGFQKPKLGAFQKPTMSFPNFNQPEMKSLDSGSDEGKGERSLFEESIANLGEEDKELLKLLTSSLPGDKNVKL